jgi:glutamate carboxypeptidase
MSEHPLIERARARQSETLALLRQIVEFESPSSEKAAVDQLVDFLQFQMEARGGTVERLNQSEYGDLLIGRFPGDEREPLFVMTHVDTVWPLGTLERLPWRLTETMAHGPGIYDMKASAAMMFAALDLLADDPTPRRPIVWLVNTEEEVGSPVSRPVLERLALEAAYTLCLEPPVPPNDALKTERKGVGMFEMEITGQAAHAGADHASGVSAVEELARQVQWLHSLTEYDLGTTVNVGVISGGTKRNVVAAHAAALIDLRVTTMAEAERMVPLLLGTEPLLEGTRVTVTGDLNRPPMERSPHVLAAYGRAREIGSSIGYDVHEATTGGGSDGNFTAALGAPTIDGLGAPGDGGHADHEHILLERFASRTAFIAALLHDL